MNKKSFVFLTLSALLLASCDLKINFDNNTQGGGDNGGNSNTPVEVSFAITSAAFTDAAGHLRVNYTCNYSSPFAVTGYTFSKLNITGVTVSELDYSQSEYFTLLSPIVDTSLKFEFYDTTGAIYITSRYANVTLFEEENPDPITPPDPEKPQIDYPNGYSTLYWSDEFDGDKLDKSNWTHEIGNGYSGWGNNEAQYYTESNDSVNDGFLTISAKKESVGGFNYTSTRIKTQNKVHFTYGYVEARIQLPTVNGMWPAFWMMPNDSVYGGWPHSGEIDIMEAKGRIPNQSSSALHFSNYDGNHEYKAHEQNGHNIGEFHKYAVEWLEGSIKYYIDDVLHFTVAQNEWHTSGAASSVKAPFDKDFYIILNLAVGGHFDNYTMPPSNFTSADMKIDYVRVFK